MIEIKINISDDFLKTLYIDTLQKPTRQIFDIFNKLIKITLIYVNVELDRIEHEIRQKLYFDDLRKRCYRYIIESFGGEENIKDYGKYRGGVKFYFYNLDLVNYLNLKSFPMRIFLSERKKEHNIISRKRAY